MIQWLRANFSNVLPCLHHWFSLWNIFTGHLNVEHNPSCCHCHRGLTNIAQLLLAWGSEVIVPKWNQGRQVRWPSVPPPTLPRPSDNEYIVPCPLPDPRPPPLPHTVRNCLFLPVSYFLLSIWELVLATVLGGHRRAGGAGEVPAVVRHYAPYRHHRVLYNIGFERAKNS